MTLARALEQVGAHGVEAVVILDARIAIELLEEREPFGRSPRHRDGHRVVQRDHRVVGHAASARRRARRSAASPCPRRAPLRRAPPRWRPAGGTSPTAPRVIASVTSRTPSAIASLSQSERSCSSSGTISPFGPERAGAPRVGEEHEREEAAHLAVCRGGARAPRARGGSLRSRDPRAGARSPELAAYPSLKMR